MENEKSVDNSWKEDANAEKETASCCSSDNTCSCSDNAECSENSKDEMKVDFISYVTSLGFQAMIFLGLVPNPITNKIDKNIKQAKFIIDTLSMMKEKTKNNLSKEEDNILESSVYELQIKYVDVVNQEGTK